CLFFGRDSLVKLRPSSFCISDLILIEVRCCVRGRLDVGVLDNLLRASSGSDRIAAAYGRDRRCCRTLEIACFRSSSLDCLGRTCSVFRCTPAVLSGSTIDDTTESPRNLIKDRVRIPEDCARFALYGTCEILNLGIDSL